MDERNETIRYTVDVITVNHNGAVLLIERGWDPHAGVWALPGGHVDIGETSREAAARELVEETGIAVGPDRLRLVGVFDRPDRDPRGRYVSVTYAVDVEDIEQVTAGDDAVDVGWFWLDDLPPLAFDHADMLRAYRL